MTDSTYPLAQPASSPKIKPGKKWFWIGGLLILASVIGAIALIVVGVVNFANTVDGFARVVAPTEGTRLDFKKSGSYTIYHESKSKVSGETINSPDDLRFGIQIVDSEGNELDVEQTTTSTTYTVGGRTGASIATVDIPSAGSYVMSVQSDGDQRAVLAVGKGLISTTFAYVGAGLAVGFIGTVLGLIILIVTGVKRSRRKKEARQLAYQPQPGYAPTAYAPSEYQAPAPQPAPAPEPPPAPQPAPAPPAPAPAPAPQPAPAPAPEPAPAPAPEPGPQPAPPPPPPPGGGGGWAPPPPPPS